MSESPRTDDVFKQVNFSTRALIENEKESKTLGWPRRKRDGLEQEPGSSLPGLI